MEDVTQARFETPNQELYQRQLALVNANASMPAIVTLLPAAAMWIILFVGGREILAGRMQVPEFFTFAIYVYELTFPTFIMGWVVALVQRGAASMQRIDELLSTEPAIADRAEPSAHASCAARSSSESSPSATRARSASRRCVTSAARARGLARSAWWAPWARARARSPR